MKVDCQRRSWYAFKPATCNQMEPSHLASVRCSTFLMFNERGPLSVSNGGPSNADSDNESMRNKRIISGIESNCHDSHICNKTQNYNSALNIYNN